MEDQEMSLIQRLKLSQEKEKEVFPILGYAPGNYLCTCFKCNERFEGDKRARECFPCAINTLRSFVDAELLKKMGNRVVRAIADSFRAADNDIFALTTSYTEIARAIERSGFDVVEKVYKELDKEQEDPKPSNHASKAPGPVNCRRWLEFQKKTYPRTCQRCGLGPCPFYYENGDSKLPNLR